jgi:hypothetical protein
VYLRGTHNGWVTSPMTRVAGTDDTWTGQAQFGAGPDERFRFEVTGNESGTYGDSDRDGIADRDGADIPVTQGAGTYTVTFDATTRVYSVVRAGFASTYPTMTVRGTNNDWGVTPMALVADHTWRVTTVFGANLVEEFVFDVDGTGATTFGDSDVDGAAEINGSRIPMTQGPATYDITFHDDSLRYTVVRTA